MTSIASSVIHLQTSPQSVPSTPSWLGEVALVAHYLTSQGVMEQIARQVHSARPRFGRYDSIDFVVVLMGYALSGEPTLAAFYERLLPFARPFMALFGRDRLPHRSTLSRFLASIDQPCVEALRTLFQHDLLARPCTQADEHPGGLWDRCGERWHVFDVDGTRQAARQRALPHTSDLLKPFDASRRSALLDIWDANVVRRCVRALRFFKHIRSSGWERLERGEMEITGESSCGQHR
jgi:hypothetical protein